MNTQQIILEALQTQIPQVAAQYSRIIRHAVTNLQERFGEGFTNKNGSVYNSNQYSFFAKTIKLALHNR